MLLCEKSKRRDSVGDFGLSIAGPGDAGDIETHAFHRRIVLVASLPQALARSANAAALLPVDATESARPCPRAPTSDLNDSDYGAQSRHDVYFEASKAQICRDDVVPLAPEESRHRLLRGSPFSVALR